MKKFFQERKRIICILAPAVIGLVYLLLCFLNMRQSIWFDESYSAYLMRFDFGKIWEFTSLDVHPPLYYFLLKVWAHLFGHEVATLRVMSALIGALAILFIYLWVKYKYGAVAAIVSSFMVAISPIFVRYGQEMRMYTLVMLIIFAATYVLQLAVDNKKKRWWIIYAILVAAGMWTHYFCAFAWVAHLVYLAIIYKKKLFQKKIVLTYILAVALFIPWMPSLWAQTKSVQQSFWIGDTSVESLASYATETLVYNRASETKGWLLVLFLVASIVIVSLLIRYRKKLSMLITLAVVPIIVLVLLSMPPLEPMFVSRYVLYSMVAIYIIEGITLVLYTRKKLNAKKPKKLHWYKRPTVAIACVAIIMLGTTICGLVSVYSYGNYNFVTYKKSTSKDLLDNVITLDNYENLPIISQDSWLYYDLSAYTSAEHPVLFIDEITEYEYGSQIPLQQSYFGKISDLDKFLESHDAIWFVGIQPEDREDLEFPREGWRVSMRSNLQFDDRSDAYQILKLEKEQI